MSSSKDILIAGAGPSGLSSALFLHELGYQPRIIDKKTAISPYSKALGVNPRSLEILEKINITDRFLQNGRKMSGMNMWRGDKHIFRNDFSRSQHNYPFLLIQPQKESEEILLEEVLKRKINVEYGVQFGSYAEDGKKYISTFQNGKTEQYSSDYIIAADGGHSVIRKQLQVEFKGLRYKESWELYDVELEMNLNADDAHIRVFPEGGMIMIRIKDKLWRVAGNLKDLLSYLPSNTQKGAITWKSDFFVSHHVAGKLTKENIVLIGDAAHLHSPIGGRGMNLGIEDAYIVSKLIHENRLHEYDKLRRSYLEKVVGKVNAASQVMAARSGYRRFLKSQLGIFKPFFPLIKPIMRNFALGLDGNKLF